jgi:gentisate 1,2-dioxygenase
MNTLGTLEELPLDYRKTLEDEHLAPLWPMLRDVLPHDAPGR